MKIVSIVGARPQFIKLAPLSSQLRKYHSEIIIHTGQHYSTNMSENFFSELHIPKPDYNLEVGSGLHGFQTGHMLFKIETVLLNEKPDLVTVFGDTNSTLAGALSSSKLHIPVAHIEAGLRSFNRNMPEEINRILTDHCSDLLFAPTAIAIKNLNKEGLESISHLSGDIMLDTLMMNKEKARSNTKILKELNLNHNKYILLTLHRPYNVDNVKVIKDIVSVLGKVKERIIFPIHPRTKKMFEKFNININENIITIEPVGYLDFLSLQLHAKKIITDSGGIQKEAYLLKKPCITIRPETEWIETVEAGWNCLVGFNSKKLYDAINNFEPKAAQVPIFGEYSVAEKMVNIINQLYN